MEFDLLSHYAQGLAKHIVRSALTPALWLCCSALIPFAAAYFFSDRPALQPLCIPLGILGGALFIPGIAGFFYLLFKNPSKLQSEEFLLRQQALAIIKKGAPSRKVDAEAIATIVMPAFEEADKTEQEP
jgi:hypothetical protein